MELELKGEQLSGYSLILDTTLYSEETLESIVPDACPDILRVLNTTGYVCLKSREVREGRLELRGMVYVQILYLPDGEEGVRHMDVNIPFAVGLDHGALHAGCTLKVSPCVLSTDTRMLNPRKVYVRAEISLGVTCYSPNQKKMVSGCQCEPRLGIREKKESGQTCLIKGVQHKAFSFSEDLSLPGSKPDPEELLSYSAAVLPTESKVIGSKLVFKGQIQLIMLYRDGDHQLTTALFELPFSQMMEVYGATEELECELEVIQTDIACQIDREDPRRIQVSVGLLAQAVLREMQEVELLADFYSTAYECAAEFQEEYLCQFSSVDSMRQEVREMVETPLPVKTVIHSGLTIGAVNVSWEGRLLLLSADLQVNLLYQREDGEYDSLTQPLSVVCRMEGDPKYLYRSWCRCVGERYATPTAGGIEVRVPLDFFYRMEYHKPIRSVLRAKIDEDAPCDPTKRPSIVLRMPSESESLWEIAKAYFTTTEEIMEANNLSEHGSVGGRMLLIPKKR